MKMHLTKVGIAACACFFSIGALANPIELIPPGPEQLANSNPSTELSALIAAITAYNTAHGTSLPAAGAIDQNPQVISGGNFDNGQVKTPSSPTSITLDFGAHPETYLILKWGNETEFWYVGGE